MENQDRHIEEPTGDEQPEVVRRTEPNPHTEANGRSPTNGQAEVTQVGQVIRSLSQTTRPPAALPRQHVPVNGALRERISVLVAALGDSNHVLHQQAVHELVAIGDPAVPALNEALNPRRPWLTSFRAAEALGQIGDGRASGPLIEALRHPNSNVRWSAVRALSAIGDARALLDLRRVARDDRGKTSWGEPVAGAAQSALDQMRTQNVLLRGADLVKTAIACVIMLVSLILAWSVVTSLRAELRELGHQQVSAVVVPPRVTLNPTTAAEPSPAPTVEPSPQPTAAPSEVIGQVLGAANVRALPSASQGAKIGLVSAGDDVVFLGTTPERDWYRVRLGQRYAPSSRINSSDGTGWVSSSLLSLPEGDVAVEQVNQPAPTARP